MKIIKNILLIVMIIVCVFLSSKVWLQLPNYLNWGDEIVEDGNNDLKISLWKIVKPNKYYINDSSIHYTYNNPMDYKIWELAVQNLEIGLRNFSESRTNLVVGEYYPEDSIIMEFDNSIPIEIFLERFGIEKKNIRTKLNYIEKVVIGIKENNSIYIYNGDSTVIIKNSKINNEKVITSAKDLIKDNYIECNLNTQIMGESLPVSIPNIEYALNPVYVRSELDISDNLLIEGIAKDYFKKDFDYVRKSKEIEGNLLFVYKNEKVLKISSEGLLDFFDANISRETDTNMYENLVTALNFTNNFLEFPDDVYLSKVETLQYDGNFGYKFIFNYRILNYPIIFSKLRDSQPLEVEVIGNKVISYKRLIRNIDINPENDMKKDQILSADLVIMNSVKLNIELKNQDNEAQNQDNESENQDNESKNQDNESENQNSELKTISKEMIKEIDNIYLAYYDRGKSPGEQHLIVAWVIDINNESYIFNAITGKILE
ncbi:hypothetical protein JYG23_10030 [Sedimentibacter sp. zth1]|uniref:hypothetical protein n=1 Tax=Sedimentibacter sp. zth1 TaxID=2816908 RepID=UPI001A92CCD1|nr:hypothetical protein [Sedimentibacter sp. zth1]QSX05024.1 hypothetical protein JYG23_10030 [Sedimentibacter sp. zth1]